MTARSVKAVADVVRQKGSDAWFQLAPADLLAHYDPAADPDAPAGLTRDDLTHAVKGEDILDVWFESGSSWNAVMRQRFGASGYPVEVYLEGSDQHRGWFQLSLLASLGVTGRAPFKAVLTHGFMVDKDGKKLSKSAGHTIEALYKDYGADVLRWWVSGLAYEHDMKVDDTFFKLAGESYRKVRNTLRFLLSNLSDFEPPAPANNRGKWTLDIAEMGPYTPEAWLLARLDELSGRVRLAYERFEFRAAHQAIYDFCNDTLSAVYLAAVKDRLYCDKPDAPRRRRAQAAIYLVTDTLCRLLAPILCHTADEAYTELVGEKGREGLEAPPGCGHERRGVDVPCVHLLDFAKPLGIAEHPDWAKAMDWREEALKALDRAKAADGGVENPLDAALTCPHPELAHFDPADLADLCGVSRVEPTDAAQTEVRDLRDQPRCERSWKRDPTVKPRSDGGLLCDRDAEAVGLA